MPGRSDNRKQWLGTVVAALVVGSSIAHGCRLYESGVSAELADAGPDGSGCTIDCDAGRDTDAECAPGTADCDGDPSTCETEILSNRAHCGACGHDCLGGSCTLGSCEPAVLAMRAGARSLLRTEDGVYFTTTDGGTTGEVLFLPIHDDGGAPPEGVLVLATGQENPTALSADDTFVYWGNLGGVSVMRALRRGDAGATSIADAQAGPIETVLGAEHVYWVNVRDTLDAGGVHRARKDGGERVLLGPSGPGARGLVGDTVDLYWVNEQEHTILRVARDGGAPAVLATHVNGDAGLPNTGPFGLAVGSGGVLYVSIDGTDGGIYSLPTTGLAPGVPPTPLVTRQSTVRGILADAKYVYFARGGAEGTVARATRDGGTVEVLARGQPFPFALALDDRAIYWVNVGAGADGGSLMRLAK